MCFFHFQMTNDDNLKLYTHACCCKRHMKGPQARSYFRKEDHASSWRTHLCSKYWRLARPDDSTAFQAAHKSCMGEQLSILNNRVQSFLLCLREEKKKARRRLRKRGRRPKRLRQGGFMWWRRPLTRQATPLSTSTLLLLRLLHRQNYQHREHRQLSRPRPQRL